MVREKATESGNFGSNNFALSAAFLVYSAPHVIHCKGTIKSGYQDNISFLAGLSKVIVDTIDDV
jgi:hypothetical protein